MEEKCEASARPRLPIQQSLLGAKPKVPKRYPPVWRPSRRQGQRNVVTTLYNVHQDEALPILGGAPPPEAVTTHFFRCRGFGEEHPLDPRLLEAIQAAAIHFATARVELISAYRSPKFNDCLAKKGRHVAAESKHTQGMAVDVRFVGTPAAEVGEWLFERFDGGVGTYNRDDFVHIDVGEKRRWRGR